MDRITQRRLLRHVTAHERNVRPDPIFRTTEGTIPIASNGIRNRSGIAWESIRNGLGIAWESIRNRGLDRGKLNAARRFDAIGEEQLSRGASRQLDIKVREAVFSIPAHAARAVDADFHFADFAGGNALCDK